MLGRRRRRDLRRPEQRAAAGPRCSQLANGAAGPGHRPVIADSRSSRASCSSSRSTAPTSCRASRSSSTTSRPTTWRGLSATWSCGTRIAEPDAAGARRARRARRHAVRGRPAPVPAGGVRAHRPVGARQVRGGRLRRRPPRGDRRRQPGRGRVARRATDPEAPTVLLYAHYDVQPPLDEDAWRTPPFELTEVDGRWYGRGAADCKGNIVMHLAALRALGDDLAVNLKLVVEGSEEQGTGGLEAFVPEHADLLRADTILVCDTGNAAVGVPAATVSLRGMVNVVVTVEALRVARSTPGCSAAPPRRPRRPGRDAGHPARRARATPRSTGSTTARPGRVRRTRPTSSARTPECVDGASLLGGGSVSDMLWARPARHHPRHRLPAGRRLGRGDHASGSGAAQPPHPAGHGPGGGAATPWSSTSARPRRGACRSTVETEATGAPFRAATDGPGLPGDRRPRCRRPSAGR